MNFGEALQALKDGEKIKRSIWGGYWYLAKKSKLLTLPIDENRTFYENDYTVDIIVAVLKDDAGVAPAQPYQSDLLAEDWEIVS